MCVPSVIGTRDRHMTANQCDTIRDRSCGYAAVEDVGNVLTGFTVKMLVTVDHLHHLCHDDGLLALYLQLNGLILHRKHGVVCITLALVQE